MCGNFGLLSLGEAPKPDSVELSDGIFKKPKVQTDALDQSLNESMHEVSRLHGLSKKDKDKKSSASNGDGAVSTTDDDLAIISPVSILRAQTSSTEIRGGQAGGYSSFEYKQSAVGERVIPTPLTTRVRTVARKRHPLAADLANHYLNARGGRAPESSSTLTGEFQSLLISLTLFYLISFQSLDTLDSPRHQSTKSPNYIHTNGCHSTKRVCGCSTKTRANSPSTTTQW